MDGALIVSIIGVALSLWALSRSSSAIKIARSIVYRANEQEDTIRLRGLLETLQNAKQAAARRELGAPQELSSGFTVTLAGDIGLMQQAKDVLRTGLPLEMAPQVSEAAGKAANDMEKAFQEINDEDSERDGWKDALSALQNVIPVLELEERRQKNVALLAR